MVVRTTRGSDLTAHTNLTDPEHFERSRRVREQMLGEHSNDWREAFDRDINLLGRIVRDILKLDQSVPGRPGPRPEPEADERSLGLLRQLMGEDYTTMPFHEAVNVLAGVRSNTQLSRIFAISETQVIRLRRDRMSPSLDEIASIARAFGKHPSFFVEYRIAYITGALASRLGHSPEASVRLYRALSRSKP